MNPTVPPRARRCPRKFLALPCGSVVLLALLAAQPVRAQSSAPAVDRQTVRVARVAKGALQRAAQVWGKAAVLDGGAAAATAGGGSAATGAGSATVHSVAGAALTGSAGAAAIVLVQAVGVIGASAAGVYVHVARTGSIARYGNPYGLPSRDIAFPLLRNKPSQPTVPKPFPVPDPGEERPDKERRGRLYATYTRYNQKSGLYYSGRTSAVIDLNKNWRSQAWAAVRARHRNRNGDEHADPGGADFEDAKLDDYAVGHAVDYTQRYRDAGYLAIRGREQQLIDYHGRREARARGITSFRGGARSDSGPDEPLTENLIRAVARDNPWGELFHAAANLAFGELAPYTGERIYK